MKLLALLGFVLTSIFVSAQDTWNFIPSTPAAPPAGSTTAPSADVLLADDGRIYSTYIFYNGTDHILYVDEYSTTLGTWNNIFTDIVYAGFQTIHSQKKGNELFFSVIANDPFSQEKIRVYKITTGSVSMVSDVIFSNLAAGADYDFTLSENGQFAYVLHQDFSNVNFLLKKIDLFNNTIAGINIPVNNSPLNNYDMVEHTDTVYVGYNSGVSVNSFYLYKIPSDFTSALTYTSSNATGILSASTSSQSRSIIMAKNTIDNTIHVLGRGASTTLDYSYSPQTAQVTLNPGNIVNDPSAQAITHCTLDTLLTFSNFTDGLGGPIHTVLLRKDFTNNTLDTINDFYFNGLGAQATNHRFNYTRPGKRFAVSMFNVISSSREYWISNTPLAFDPATTIMGSACAGSFSTLCPTLVFNDLNYDQITILGVSSSDINAMDPSTISYNNYGTSGTSSFFSIFGTPGVSGTFVLTVTATDGFDTITFDLPSITISNPPIPQFNTSIINICSGNGIVDLNQYIDIQGGNFYVSLAEVNFFNGLIDSDNPMLNIDQVYLLEYSINLNGCTVNASTNISAHDSPIVSIATTNTTCGAATGTATATVAGGLQPLTTNLWSNGVQNSGNVNGLSEGIYTYTIKDGNQCEVISTFSIVPAGVDVTATVTPVVCHNQSNGSIVATPVGMVAPYIFFWSSGHSTNTINNMSAGSYTVQITDANNCLVTKTFVIPEPAPLFVETTFLQPNCSTADGTMEVLNVSGGTFPYTYAWSDGSTGTIVNNVGFGIYSVTITDANGCQAIENFYMSENNSADLYGTISGTDCGTATGSIDVYPFIPSGLPIQSISWSNGATTEDIFNLPSADYICTLVVANNCKAVKGWNIPVVAPQQQTICVVTVDSTTTTNLVVWERVQPVGIAYYNIYRETSVQSEYVLIDTVQASNLTVFNDVVASPTSRAWSYKIGAVNGCGVESTLSPQHRTMHLSVLDNGASGVTVSWNAYQGAAYTEFIVSRFTNATGWEVIASIPATQTSYSDNIAFNTAGLDYMVELALTDMCTATIYKAQDFNTTRSNRDKGSFSVGDGTGNSNNSITESYLNNIVVFPNPTTDRISIVQEGVESINYTLTTLSGAQLLQTISNTVNTELDLSDLSSGIYLLEITTNGIRQTRRIIKD